MGEEGAGQREWEEKQNQNMEVTTLNIPSNGHFDLLRHGDMMRRCEEVLVEVEGQQVT